MVRATLAVKAKRALLEGKQAAAATPTEAAGPRPPSHIARKLTRKVKFLERVAATKPALAAKSGVTKKKKKRQPSAALNSLPLLSESLAESVALRDQQQQSGHKHKPLGTSVGTLRARERVAEKEMPRLQAVLEHPQFQANPIAAITSHLSATLPPPPPPQPVLSKAELQQRRRDKKRRQRQRTSAAKREAAGDMVDDE